MKSNNPSGFSQAVRVRPFYRVVANGVVATGVDSESVRVRATLVATPEPADDGDGFSFSEWPRAMAELLSQGGKFSDDATQAKLARHKIRLRLEVPAAAATLTLPLIEADVVGHARVGDLKAWDPVKDLRRQSITGAMVDARVRGGRPQLGDPWKLLLDDIRQSLTANKHEAEPKRLLPRWHEHSRYRALRQRRRDRCASTSPQRQNLSHWSGFHKTRRDGARRRTRPRIARFGQDRKRPVSAG